MLYILLAGGVFNAVLVPQLVRTMSRTPTAGRPYTNRIITLAALFLGAVTVVLLVAGRAAGDVALPRLGVRTGPTSAAQRDSIIDFARLCLPQVFFYGMFVLVGQILNARGKFGPMMWAPIANNVISVAGPGRSTCSPSVPPRATTGSGRSPPARSCCSASASTAGIVAQLLILVPFLRAAGFTFRPRFDFRGTGLGRTLRLGGVDGALRHRQPDRLHRGRPTGLQRHRRRHRGRRPATWCTPRPS